MNDKMLEKIASLLSKAESTDSEHEAAALVEAAQRIASTYAIDMALAEHRRSTRRASEMPVVQRVAFEQASTNRNLKKHLVSLMSAVARPNDVKMDIFHNSSGVILYGYASDIAAAQSLWGSLSVQMVSAAEEYMRKGEWRGETMYREDRWGYREAVRMDARVARNSFYRGYISSISDRLQAARRAAVKEAQEAEQQHIETAGSSEEQVSTVLVLAQKTEKVRSFYKSASDARGSWQGSKSKASSQRSRSAGRTAGEKARLSTQAGVGGNRGAIAG